MLLLLLACATAPETAPAIHIPLDAPRLARRLSLDLRGVLPTPEELDAVEADPAALDELREQYLADPRFEERVVVLYQERWRTAVDQYRAYYYDYGLAPEQNHAYLRAVGEEPLRVVARIAADDRPYTEVATADWSMATELSAGFFPVDYPEGATGWQEVRYTDARPAAGVLATNGLWFRYISPVNNFNRGRAAAIIDLLTCEDLLLRPVVFADSLSIDAEQATEAVVEDPACLACHAALEPVAATLFGFIPWDDQSALEMTRYHPEREHLGEETLGVATAWFGTPVTGLEALGRAVALDPRFVDCAVRTVAEGLLRRPAEDADAALIEDARERFVDGGLRLKDVFRAVTDTEAWRAGALAEAATEADRDRETTRRILLASQLRTVWADLSGFAWTRDGADLLDYGPSGFRVLGGSVDGEEVQSPQRTAGLTWALVARRAAQAAARQAVDHDLAPGAAPYLLDGVDATTLPEHPAFRETIAALHWRLFAVRPTDADVDAFADLWVQVHDATGSPSEAWASLLTAMYRDPLFLTY